MAHPPDIRPTDRYAIGTLTLVVHNKQKRLDNLDRDRAQVAHDLADAQERLAEAKRIHREQVAS